jgi:hypothetical protein
MTIARALYASLALASLILLFHMLRWEFTRLLPVERVGVWARSESLSEGEKVRADKATTHTTRSNAPHRTRHAYTAPRTQHRTRTSHIALDLRLSAFVCADVLVTGMDTEGAISARACEPPCASLVSVSLSNINAAKRYTISQSFEK